MDSKWERLITVLDPSRDREVERFSDQELAELILFLIGILGQSQRPHLEYIIRNLRRRVLYYMTPKRIISRSPNAFEIRDQIKSDLLEVVDEDNITTVTEAIRNVIVEIYWTERNYDTAEALPKIIERDGSHCRICGYRFRQGDTDIPEVKTFFSDVLYPLRNGYYDCLKPLSKKVKQRRVTIDHVVPLASFGKDDISNYGLSCEQCNNGKSDCLSFVEPRFAIGHRNRISLPKIEINEPGLFYAVVDRDRQCFRCSRGTGEVELTLIPVSSEKCIMFDTLATICYDCDDFPRRWKRVGAAASEEEDE